MENNIVKINGTIESEFKLNHSQLGENFYLATISVMRNSGVKDYIPILISDRIINVREDHSKKYISIVGQFRSHNEHNVDKSKLFLYVFVKEYELSDQKKEDDLNYIEITGFVCKPPVYRKTPLGREIADLLIAVNRSYGKSDYIPCITWGRNAKYTKGFHVGDNYNIIGRIQSREYVKKLPNEVIETRVAYEVSITRLEYQDHSGGELCV